MADDASQQPGGQAPPNAPHRFTWDEVVRLAAADVFGETTRVELIGGEIYVTPEEGFLHVDAVRVLQTWLLAQLAPLGFEICIREPVHLTDGSAVIPDLSVFPRGTDARAMQAARALLIVEVSDTTLTRDRDLKAPRYAADNVPELWIVDASDRALNVLRAPRDGAWTFVDRFTPGRTAAPLCAPNNAFDPALLPEPKDE